jgi:hypothetical protein
MASVNILFLCFTLPPFDLAEPAVTCSWLGIFFVRYWAAAFLEGRLVSDPSLNLKGKCGL